MKKYFFIFFLTGCAAIAFLSSCGRSNTSYSFYSYQTECVNIERDGSQTLKAYGMGKNRTDAEAQAKKNAVYDVIFKGISSGSRECQARPLLLEVNAEEKYRDYFNAFFANRGPHGNFSDYSRFVTLQDERFSQRIKRKPNTQNADQDVYSLIVRVLREELKQQLIQDGILKL